MPTLIAATALIGAVAIVNLLLTLAIIRRLRNAAPAVAYVPDELPELPVGSPLPDFSAVSTSGETVTATGLSGSRALFAFYDTGCPSCEETFPRLIERIGAAGLAARQVIAVVGGPQGGHQRYVDVLAGHTTVITEPPLGPVASAFAVTGWPSFVLAGADGLVTGSGSGTSALSALVTA